MTLADADVPHPLREFHTAAGWVLLYPGGDVHVCAWDRDRQLPGRCHWTALWRPPALVVVIGTPWESHVATVRAALAAAEGT